MKLSKKLLALLMALIMMFSIAVPVTAANPNHPGYEHPDFNEVALRAAVLETLSFAGDIAGGIADSIDPQDITDLITGMINGIIEIGNVSAETLGPIVADLLTPLIEGIINSILRDWDVELPDEIVNDILHALLVNDLVLAILNSQFLADVMERAIENIVTDLLADTDTLVNAFVEALLGDGIDRAVRIIWNDGNPSSSSDRLHPNVPWPTLGALAHWSEGIPGVPEGWNNRLGLFFSPIGLTTISAFVAEGISDIGGLIEIIFSEDFEFSDLLTLITLNPADLLSLLPIDIIISGVFRAFWDVSVEYATDAVADAIVNVLYSVFGIESELRGEHLRMFVLSGQQVVDLVEAAIARITVVISNIMEIADVLQEEGLRAALELAFAMFVEEVQYILGVVTEVVTDIKYEIQAKIDAAVEAAMEQLVADINAFFAKFGVEDVVNVEMSLAEMAAAINDALREMAQDKKAALVEYLTAKKEQASSFVSYIINAILERINDAADAAKATAKAAIVAELNSLFGVELTVGMSWDEMAEILKPAIEQLVIDNRDEILTVLEKVRGIAAKIRWDDAVAFADKLIAIVQAKGAVCGYELSRTVTVNFPGMTNIHVSFRDGWLWTPVEGPVGGLFNDYATFIIPEGTAPLGNDGYIWLRGVNYLGRANQHVHSFRYYDTLLFEYGEVYVIDVPIATINVTGVPPAGFNYQVRQVYGGWHNVSTNESATVFATQDFTIRLSIAENNVYVVAKMVDDLYCGEVRDVDVSSWFNLVTVPAGVTGAGIDGWWWVRNLNAGAEFYLLKTGAEGTMNFTYRNGGSFAVPFTFDGSNPFRSIFGGTSPSALNALLAAGDVILVTLGNYGVSRGNTLTIPEGRTLYVASVLNIRREATLDIGGNVVVLNGGRINNDADNATDNGGTIKIAASGLLVNYGHVENASGSNVFNYGKITNNGRFEVRARATLHNVGVIDGLVSLNIHRDAIIRTP